MFKNFAKVAVDEVNFDIASNVVQHLGGFRKEFMLYFHKISKTNLDLEKNCFVVLVKNVADCMKDELIDLQN